MRQRFGDSGTADSASRSGCSCCASVSGEGVQLHVCLGQACSWEWKNTFSVHLLLVLSMLMGATPVQIMLNSLSMDSQLVIKLKPLNYPWPQMRDGKPQWQHQSLSLLGPNRDIVIRKQLNAKQIKKEMGSPGAFSQVPG